MSKMSSAQSTSASTARVDFENGHNFKVWLWLHGVWHCVPSAPHTTQACKRFEKICRWQKQSSQPQNTKAYTQRSRIHFSISMACVWIQNANHRLVHPLKLLAIRAERTMCVCLSFRDVNTVDDDDNSSKLFIHSFRTLCSFWWIFMFQ